MPQQDLSDFTTTQVVHFSRANDENIGGAVLIGQIGTSEVKHLASKYGIRVSEIQSVGIQGE